jgi:SAM-dependent methyltransferase
MSLLRHYSNLFKNIVKIGKKDKKISRVYNLLKTSLIRPNYLWNFTQDPNNLGFKIKFFAESLDKMHFEDNFFDKVFCISVVEHLSERTAFRGMREMARVLKKGGLLIVTVDHDDVGSSHNPKLRGAYKKLIKASGLRLYGRSDFRKPSSKDLPGTYNVVGFVLKKG